MGMFDKGIPLLAADGEGWKLVGVRLVPVPFGKTDLLDTLHTHL
jgi:hypothetical protein